MTVVAVGARDGLAFAASDAGWMDPHGRLVRIASKLTSLPHLNMVVALSGTAREDIDEQLAAFAAAFTDPHEYLRGLPTFAQETNAPVGAATSFAAAMFDRSRHEASAWLVVPRGSHFAPGAEWEIHRVMTAFNPGAPLARWPGDSFDPRRDARELMDRFRSDWGPGGGIIANGFGEMAIVTARGIRRRVVVDWHDRLDVAA